MMEEKTIELNRRKFMTLGSVAAVSTLVLGTVAKPSTARAESCDIIYRISSDCIGCHFCFNECPESAIHWGDDKYVIDQDKCVQCGTCAEVCNISAAHAELRF